MMTIHTTMAALVADVMNRNTALLLALLLCGCDPEPYMPAKPTGQWVQQRVIWTVASRDRYSEPNILGFGYSPSYYLVYTNEAGEARQMEVGLQRWMDSQVGSVRVEMEWVWREPR